MRETGQKKGDGASPALPTLLVFQQGPNDTLWRRRFKGTRSEGDLVQLPQISWPTFSGPRSDCGFCSQPHLHHCLAVSCNHVPHQR